MVNGGVETFNPFTVVIPFISLIELNIVNRFPSISRMNAFKTIQFIDKTGEQIG